MVHTIRVPRAWLDRGATIELELPRSLTCARCDGGGCDRCGRAGAIRLRLADDPAQTVQVCLPDPNHLAPEQSSKSLVLRIPDAGGHADGDELPRGVLMLHINESVEPDASVRLAGAAELLRELRAPREVVVRSAVIAGLLFLAFLWMLHLSGWL